MVLRFATDQSYLKDLTKEIERVRKSSGMGSLSTIYTPQAACLSLGTFHALFAHFTLIRVASHFLCDGTTSGAPATLILDAIISVEVFLSPANEGSFR
jgi:hypothetical protein